MKNTSRRDFVKKSLYIVAAGVGCSMLGKTAEAQAVTKAVDENAPMAKTLAYVADASKSTNPLRIKPTAKDQNCGNCMLLQQAGLKADGQSGEWGKCALFQDGLVSTKGWCQSWSPKAA